VPQPVDPRAALDEQAGHLPAAVADGVIEWSSTCDRCTARLDVGAPIDQRSGHLDVIAACGPVQRRFCMPASLDGSAGICPRTDQHEDDLGPVWEEPGPICRRVQSSARPSLLIDDSRGGQAGALGEQRPEGLDIAGVDRLDQGPGRRIILRQPQAWTAWFVSRSTLRHEDTLQQGPAKRVEMTLRPRGKAWGPKRRIQGATRAHNRNRFGLSTPEAGLRSVSPNKKPSICWVS